MAADSGTGFIIESATWRASPDWGDLLGYSRAALADANRLAVESLVDVRAALETENDVVVSGCIGPRGDGYDGTARMDAKQARDYHSEQVQTFAGTDADMVHAMTMTYPDEAAGVVLAAREAQIPVAISFTVRNRWCAARRDQGSARPSSASTTPQKAAPRTTPSTALTRRTSPTCWTQTPRGPSGYAACGRLAQIPPERDRAPSLASGAAVELGAQYAELRSSFRPSRSSAAAAAWTYDLFERLPRRCPRLEAECGLLVHPGARGRRRADGRSCGLPPRHRQHRRSRLPRPPR